VYTAKYRKIVEQLGSAPNPTGGAYSVPHTPLLVEANCSLPQRTSPPLSALWASDDKTPLSRPLLFFDNSHADEGWSVGVEFNAPLDTI